MSLFGAPLPRRGKREEAEKPFWISFADLMTGLMVLFLVAMTVALLAITHEMTEGDKLKLQREQEIDTLLERLKQAAQQYPGVSVRGRAVDFGDRARFDSDSHRLTSSQESLLRTFVPQILQLANDPLGEKWIKRVVVEGFADARGSYLHNLNLSLHRSERVLCTLLVGPEVVQDALPETSRQQVRDLFLVSGASFNGLKESAEESRRIEMRLEFLEINEQREPPRLTALDSDNRCPLDYGR